MNKEDRLRTVVAGGVGTSRRTLEALLRNGVPVIGVLGLSAAYSAGASGYCRMDDIAVGHGIPYLEFKNINDPAIVEAVRRWAPDLVFAVGLSQLLKIELLKLPRLGCIGFHPTWLPEGRGRAPVAWLTLNARCGAATFFLMGEETDSGPIVVQQPFFVSEQDYASDVMRKVEEALDVALDRWLPTLLAGEWNAEPQDESLATFNALRTPEDGLIDWHRSTREIHALIRAASHPYPGAYTYIGDHKLIVWRAEVEHHLPIRGVVGRIVRTNGDKCALVQAGDGLLWLTESEIVAATPITKHPPLRVGLRLGYAPQDEVFALKARIAELENRLARLESINCVQATGGHEGDS